jgi:hypothetical protein
MDLYDCDAPRQEIVVYYCSAWMGRVRRLQDQSLIHLLTLEYSF